MTRHVDVTEPAAELLRSLTNRNGPLMLHQSGGCCDGSSPQCYAEGEFLIGDSDVHLGDLEIGLDRDVPVHMSSSQYEVWKYSHITIDVVKGRGSGFSLESPEGMKFIVRSRLLSDAESEELGLLA